jgi:hypothetical protein
MVLFGVVDQEPKVVGTERPFHPAAKKLIGET